MNKLIAVLLFATAAALAPVRQVATKVAVSNKVDISKPFAAVVAATPVALAAQPAVAFPSEVAGLPIGLVLTGFPIIVAASVALIVIGPGAIQQFKRVFSGESSKYMKGDY